MLAAASGGKYVCKSNTDSKFYIRPWRCEVNDIFLHITAVVAEYSPHAFRCSPSPGEKLSGLTRRDLPEKLEQPQLEVASKPPGTCALMEGSPFRAMTSIISAGWLRLYGMCVCVFFISGLPFHTQQGDSFLPAVLLFGKTAGWTSCLALAHCMSRRRYRQYTA